MSNIFEKIKNAFSKDDNNPKIRIKRAKDIDGKHVRYVTERKNNTDEVIGRDGHINITPNGEEIQVVCGIKSIFRAKIETLSQGELLSHDGVILCGFDFETQRKRSIIAYYKYYR